MAGYDANTKLLLHFDGTNGSTSFTDRSGHTITAAGNAQLSTTSPKLGAASLLLDGTGDYAAITYATDLLIGTGAFGIDFWCKPAANQTTRALIASNALTDAAFQIRIDTTTNRVNYQSRAGAVSLTGPTMSNGTWYHIFFGRQGTTFYYSTNGNGTVASSATAGSNNFSSATDIWVGADPAADQGQFNGNIDEVRMTVGACPWTANYTPPTAMYGVDDTASATEAASATDNDTTIAALIASLAEASTATDILLGGLFFLDSLAETATATESVNRAYTTLGALSEAATASESRSVLAAYLSSISEILNATDTPSSVKADFAIASTNVLHKPIDYALAGQQRDFKPGRAPFRALRGIFRE